MIVYPVRETGDAFMERIMPIIRPTRVALIAALLSSTAYAQSAIDRHFDADSLRIEELAGTLTVNVAPGATGVQVSVSGADDRVKAVELSSSGSAVVISAAGGGDWWDSIWGGSSSDADLSVTVTLPEGAAIKISDFMGLGSIGDTRGPIAIDTMGGTMRVGEVSEARIEIAGSGDISIGRVTGPARGDIAGSGSIHFGDVKNARADIAGGGYISFGAVEGEMRIDIAGSGEVNAKSVNGQLDIDVAGSGSVAIEDGAATPMNVDIVGSGSVRFGGTAHDPSVTVMGSGDIWLSSYTGSLSSEGATVRTGDQN